MTLGEWLDIWINERVADFVRPTTMNGYRQDLEHHVKPYLGQRPLLKVTTDDLNDLYAQLLEHGRLVGRSGHGSGLSATTVRGIHTTLHHALKTAAEEGLLPTNPADKAIPPKITRTAKRVLNNEQLDRFLGALKGDPIWHDFFYTEMTTGLRRGELCGLKWETSTARRERSRCDGPSMRGRRGTDGRRAQNVCGNPDYPAAVQYGTNSCKSARRAP